MRRLSLLVLPILVVLGCSKPKPSADYAEAQAAFDSVTARMGDDAYADAEMARIEGLLARVPADSPDAAAANALKGKIASEKARVAEDNKRREADLAVLRAPVAAAPSPIAEEPKPPPPPPPTDPVEDSSQPQVGLPLDQFQKKFGPCFSEGEMITVSNLGVRARAFSLGGSEDCKKKHADFATKWVLINEGKIIGMVGKDSVKQMSATPDAGPAPARAPVARADAGA